MTSTADPSPTLADARETRHNLAWLLGVVVLAGATTLPMWREVAARVVGPPGVLPREVYAKGDPNVTFDHGPLDAVLATHVDADGFVDYGAIARDPAPLDEYLATLATARFETLGRDAKLAFLINAYNAHSIRRIAAHWPLETIDALPVEAADGMVRCELFDSSLTLAQLEHDWIRAKFVEPRSHFALHRASLGGPPLLNAAYTGIRLEDQLEEQVRRTYGSHRWFRFDAVTGRLDLSQIHLRYATDFQHACGSLLNFVRRQDGTVDRFLKAGRTVQTEWLPWDRTLDSLANRPY